MGTSLVTSSYQSRNLQGNLPVSYLLWITYPTLMRFVHVLYHGSPNFDLLMTIGTFKFCTSICINLRYILIFKLSQNWYNVILDLPLMWMPFYVKISHWQIFPACTNHTDWLRVILVIYFTLCSHFRCALEYHVAYNWTFIIISIQISLKG